MLDLDSNDESLPDLSLLYSDYSLSNEFGQIMVNKLDTTAVVQMLQSPQCILPAWLQVCFVEEPGTQVPHHRSINFKGITIHTGILSVFNLNFVFKFARFQFLFFFSTWVPLKIRLFGTWVEIFEASFCKRIAVREKK